MNAKILECAAIGKEGREKEIAAHQQLEAYREAIAELKRSTVDHGRLSGDMMWCFVDASRHARKGICVLIDGRYEVFIKEDLLRDLNEYFAKHFGTDQTEGD